MAHALFLGAGFSKWAANLPLGAELFSPSIEPWGVKEAKRFERVRTLKTKWDEAHVEDSCNATRSVEEFIGYAMELPAEDRSQVSWYITRVLSEPFIYEEWHAGRWRRHVLMIDENRKWNVRGVGRASSFINEFCRASLSGIITTNYDLLVEYSLGTKRFNYGTPGEILTGRGPYPVSQWKNPVTFTGLVPLAKIHGSISWDEQRHYTDGRGAITGRALIVAPAPEKTPSLTLSLEWQLAQRILETATSLVVFGFGFNSYDTAVRDLLRNAGSGLKAVLVINRSLDAQAPRELWPAAEITPCPPPPEGDRILADWKAGWLG